LSLKFQPPLLFRFNGFHNLRAIYPLLIFSWMLHVVAVKDSISVDSISFPCSLVTDDKILETNVRRWREFTWLAYLFCSLAVLDSRVGHTMDVLSPFIPVSCHSDWLSHGESCPRLDVVHPGRAWPSSPSCTWHCSLHYLFLQETPLFRHVVTVSSTCFTSHFSGTTTMTYTIIPLLLPSPAQSKTYTADAFRLCVKFSSYWNTW